ncbi:MAG: hypothetical protein JST04_01260 [Bdellovibrionales bacterium]|nr:hypothetical protein [Bdellovibrionales bacterium]
MKNTVIRAALFALPLLATAAQAGETPKIVARLQGAVIDDWNYVEPKLGEVVLERFAKPTDDVEGWIGMRLPGDPAQVGAATLKEWGAGKSTIAKLPIIRWTKNQIEFYYSTNGKFTWTQSTLFFTKQADGSYRFSCLSDWHRPDDCGGARHAELK